MTDFRLTKQAMYSTPMDVRGLMQAFEREVEDEDGGIRREQEITDNKIEQHILNADAIILGYLLGIYGADALDSETAYFQGPITPTDNPSTIQLNGVVLATTAITEQWLIEFTAEDAYDVTGSVSGSQGSGTIAGDFTSTNSDVQIKIVDWVLGEDTAVDEGNQLIFSTYVSHPLIKLLSTKLAGADLIASFYVASGDDEPGYSRSWRKQAMDMLKALVDPKSEVSLNATASDNIGDYESVAYSVNRFGQDVTEYGNFDGDANPMDI